MKIAALVLAAGGSSRLGEPKQLLRDESGETLVHRAARDAVETGLSPVVVVVGALATVVRAAVEAPALDAGCVHVVENSDWATGLSSSIRCGVQAVVELHATVDALMILTCDMPSVGVNHMCALVTAFSAGASRVASHYGETLGIPAIIPRAEFGTLMLLDGDKGAKQLLMQPDTQTVALAGGTFDLDTPEDVIRWQSQGVDNQALGCLSPIAPDLHSDARVHSLRTVRSQ